MFDLIFAWYHGHIFHQQLTNYIQIHHLKIPFLNVGKKFLNYFLLDPMVWYHVLQRFKIQIHQPKNIFWIWQPNFLI
jgi:hypothetical protein